MAVRYLKWRPLSKRGLIQFWWASLDILKKLMITRGSPTLSWQSFRAIWLTSDYQLSEEREKSAQGKKRLHFDEMKFYSTLVRIFSRGKSVTEIVTRLQTPFMRTHLSKATELHTGITEFVWNNLPVKVVLCTCGNIKLAPTPHVQYVRNSTFPPFWWHWQRTRWDWSTR